MTQAALGSTFELETLDGPETIAVEPGTQPGHLVRLRGRGVPVLNGRGRGDLIVEIDVEVPDRLSAEEVELLVQFAQLRGEVVEPPDSGFFSRLRAGFRDR
jgi:molecular chaperone DnaJ